MDFSIPLWNLFFTQKKKKEKKKEKRKIMRGLEQVCKMPCFALGQPLTSQPLSTARSDSWCRTRNSHLVGASMAKQKNLKEKIQVQGDLKCAGRGRSSCLFN